MFHRAWLGTFCHVVAYAGATVPGVLASSGNASAAEGSRRWHLVSEESWV